MRARRLITTTALVALTAGTLFAPATAAAPDERPDPRGDVEFRRYDKQAEQWVREPADDPGIDILATSVDVLDDAVLVTTRFAEAPRDDAQVEVALMRAHEDTTTEDDNPYPKRRSLVWLQWSAAYGETFEVDERFPCEPTLRVDGASLAVRYPLACLGPFEDFRLDVLTKRWGQQRSGHEGTHRDQQDAGTFRRPVDRPVVRPDMGGGTQLLELPDVAGDVDGGTDLLRVDLDYTHGQLSVAFHGFGPADDVTGARILLATEPGGEPAWVFDPLGDDHHPDWWNDFCFGGNGEGGYRGGDYQWTVSRISECVDHWPALYARAELERSDGTVDRTVEVGPIVPGPSDVLLDGDPGTIELSLSSGEMAAAEYARLRFEEGRTAPYAVVATAKDFPDALAGTALLEEGPLFFAWPAAFSYLDELQAVLEPGRTVYVLGGPKAIGPEVEDLLTEAGYVVRRLSGPDRIATSLAVAEEVLRRWPGTTVGLARARGTQQKPEAGWVDSISAGAWAAATRTPVLLTETHALDSRVADFLRRHGIRRTVLLGGPGALSAEVAAAVPGADRVAGPDRDATAAEITRRLLPGARAHVLLDGHNRFQWSTGLAMAGPAAAGDASILFLRGLTVPGPTAALLGRCADVDVLLTAQVAKRRLVGAVEDLRRRAC